jgi:uncharacterized membrane protein YidH (DUF202 family)
MDTGSCRRFKLADGLILIAAVAAGLGITRFHADLHRQDMGRFDAVSAFELALMSIYWSALLMMMALIPMRLRRPRPPMRRLRRQPGFIACVAVVLAAAFVILDWAPSLFSRSPNWFAANILSFISSPWKIGPIVVTAWLVLALSGRWQSESSWIDRSGRFLGIAWIMGYAIYVIGRWRGS